MLSFIENGAILYSYACTNVNTTPYNIVDIIPLFVTILSPLKIPLCAQVIVTPDDNKITVFHNGNPQGSNDRIPLGGHIDPMAIEGDKLQWKNAQKKLKKNIISDTMNKHIPNLIPCRTLYVWWPSNVASTTISANQRNK
jgi:hypothetical protein